MEDSAFERWQDTRKPPRPRDPPIRPSHLKVRRYFPTHPLVRISLIPPHKLPAY